MKNPKITIIAIIAALFICLVIMGCPNDSKDPGLGNPAQGKVLILQAYGNAGDGSPGGVSHSFVELYNISDEAVDLNGISLYYANGIRDNDVTEDEPWEFIALSGTIPAKGSFLVLGAKHADLSATRYKIDDGYGDITDDNLSLSRRGFKVAVIKGSSPLTVQNPFTSNNGKPVSGYIDMVGALNNPDATPPDNIFGYETAPARNSASVAVRRRDITDTDNNSADFIAARYGPTSGDDKTLTPEELEVRKPRNSETGIWYPFADPAEPPDTSDVDYTKLKLNEVSGVGVDSEKFYELINIGAEDIPLYNCKIYYNANSTTGGTLPAGKGNLTWTGLSSQTAAAGQLFSLIGRNTAGSFTTGLTAQRILIITLEDPAGNVIDQCVRAADTGDYAITDKSFSRIPDGTGDFYFTTPTPNATNGTSTVGLTKVPVVAPAAPPVISNLIRNPSSVTPADTVTVSATVTTEAPSTITSVVLQWTLNGTAQSNITMTASGNVYSAVIPAQALGSTVTFKISAANNLDETAISNVHDYTVVSTAVNYTKLVLNEVSGNNKFVEIYNSGSAAIPMQGVKLQRNDGPTGGSEWVGTASDSIPAGAYRIFLFNSYTPADLNTNPAYVGWTVSSGISAGQILKVAIVDPSGNPVSVFIRGENPLPAWQNTSGVTQDTTNTYSRMSDGTWAYAAPTPGAVNGAKAAEIVSPGYLTAQPIDPPVISVFGRDPSSVTPEDTVTISATVTKTKPDTTITTVVLQWTLGGIAQSNISMTASGNVYSAVIPAQAVGSAITYKVSAANNLGETSVTPAQNYTVVDAPIDYSKLILNEVSGNNKFVEIYNSGTVAIPLQGVKLQRNDGPSGGSEWVGAAGDSIPAGAYRLFLFNSYTPADLNTNPAYTGWTVSSGISSGQILKVAIVDPSGTPVDVFIRGDVPLPAWQNTTGVTQNTTNTYSRMSDGTWAYAAPTPGAANGAKVADIVNPGYLTAQP